MSRAPDDHLSRTVVPIDAGRLGVFTLLGAATGMLPLPWIPNRIVKRIRGSLVHDIAARHGLSLTPEAREILTNPSKDQRQPWVRQAAEFVGLKVLGRLGPVGVIPPVQHALTTFVLGHLFNRYVETVRTERAIRLDVEEARRLRSAIDRSFAFVLTSMGGPDKAAKAPEDLRDGFTRVLDGLLITAASIPGWLVRRLNAAFDEAIGE